MSFGTWVQNVENQVIALFTAEDQALIEFFGPLMAQVKAVALELGKEDLQAGLEVIKTAAIQSVVAAAAAPESDRVKVAETTFLAVGATEGIKAIHNAEAGAIKAAVAIVQTQAANAAAANLVSNTTATAIATGASTVGDLVQKQLGG